MTRGSLEIPKEEIVTLYLGGMSAQTIADKYGCSKKTILNRLKASGIPRRKKYKCYNKKITLDSDGNQVKICSVCQQCQTLDMFGKASGEPGVLRHQCKKCYNEQRKVWREQNKETLNKKQAEYVRNRRKNNTNVAIKHALSRRIRNAVKYGFKSKNTLTLLGCSLEHFKTYLESKFEDGMTWENHGLQGWHIDHIRPCTSFDLTDEAQQKQCFHYTNTQPLWAKDNWSKSAKYDIEGPEICV